MDFILGVLIGIVGIISALGCFGAYLEYKYKRFKTKWEGGNIKPIKEYRNGDIDNILYFEFKGTMQEQELSGVNEYNGIKESYYNTDKHYGKIFVWNNKIEFRSSKGMITKIPYEYIGSITTNDRHVVITFNEYISCTFIAADNRYLNLVIDKIYRNYIRNRYIE